MEQGAKQSFSQEARSINEKHMEIMLVADHLYLQKFNTDQEATETLLTLAHMVREDIRRL